MSIFEKKLSMIYRRVARVPGMRRLKRILFGETSIRSYYVPPVCRPLDRGRVLNKWTRDRLQQQYEMSDVKALPETFVLYRIIGNDLVPRHKKGQSLRNLSFILENEPDLPDCEKRFVVNRIADEESEQKIIEMLEKASAAYIHIPFRWDQYRMVDWDMDCIPKQYAPFSRAFSRLDIRQQRRITIALYRHKNNYVMNNNGARNAALRDGKKIAKWVLPWDGNCFVTRAAWLEITKAIRNQPELPYFLVPMARITNNMKLLEAGFLPDASDEPQVIFRKDSKEIFCEAFCYGRRPKVELLWRLGVPGRWDEWGIEPWDLDCPVYVEDAGAYGYAGWVARLFSGNAQMETGQSILAERNRFMAREEGIMEFLDLLDDKAFCLGSRQERLGLFSKMTLAPDDVLPGEIRKKIKKAMTLVVDRSVGRPLPDVINAINLLSSAWKNLRDPDCLKGAATLMRKAFKDKETQFQVNQDSFWHRIGFYRKAGLISEMAGIVRLFQTVVILFEAEVIGDKDIDAFECWCLSYLHWLQKSREGEKARGSTSVAGTSYDLQVASLALFLGYGRLFRKTIRDSRARLLYQFDAGGLPREKEAGAHDLDTWCKNAEFWVTVARLTETAGDMLHEFKGENGCCLKTMLSALFTQAREAPASFDREKLLPLERAFDDWYLALE